MPDRRAPGGEPLLDVLVIGAGQSGLAISAQLLRERVDNILAIDAAEEGSEAYGTASPACPFCARHLIWERWIWACPA